MTEKASVIEAEVRLWEADRAGKCPASIQGMRGSRRAGGSRLPKSARPSRHRRRRWGSSKCVEKCNPSAKYLALRLQSLVGAGEGKWKKKKKIPEAAEELEREEKKKKSRGGGRAATAARSWRRGRARGAEWARACGAPRRAGTRDCGAAAPRTPVPGRGGG